MIDHRIHVANVVFTFTSKLTHNLLNSHNKFMEETKKILFKKNLREKKVVGKEKDRKKDVRDTDTQIESLREGEEKEWANNI